ncbi:MAG TPA: hypothetical protein VII58_04790 [Acidobacteriaceae bacterium]
MRASIVAALCLPLVLTGCTLTNTGTPSLVQGADLLGSVHGGQQPISGAHVYLFAANTTGYGNASVSLLNAGATGHSDSVGAYVLSNASGNFSISGDYSCTPNTQVYVYAFGGDPGAGANSHAALLAALGNCPSGGNFAGSVPFINVNEVTTVATAYAIAGFATDATHVSSSGTALAQTGIQNAFANAANLATLSTGAAATTTTGGNGTPPTSEINTLANVLAACINSNGAVTGPTNPSACYTLFANALSGGTTGTQPADTAAAAINIAHNPGANVAALYGLPGAQPPFAPSLTTQPNDWTVGIQFAEGGDPAAGGTNDPYAIAIDQDGNIWAANNGGTNIGVVAKLGPDGAIKSGDAGFSDGTSLLFDGIAIDLNGDIWGPSFGANCLVKFRGSDGLVLSPPGGITGGGLNGPHSLAIDGSDNAWIANANGDSVSEYSVDSNTWVSSTGYTGGSLSSPWSIAIDHAGNAWVVDKNNTNTLTELTGGGATQNTYTGIGGISAPLGVAIDAAGDIWVASSGSLGAGNVSELSNAGSALSPFSGYGAGAATGGIINPQSIAIDGAGNAWTGDASTISGQSVSPIAEFDNSGNAISPSNGYVAPGIVDQTVAIAVDGSGNVWAADPSANYLVELVGAATPVVTPLSVATKNNTLGTRP